jgi:hypothetical protein
MSTVTAYVMDPALDTVLFGDEITEGMWVLPEDSILRSLPIGGEEEQLRRQRFCRVTKLRRSGTVLVFVGEWVDGYQEVLSYNECHGWIVRKAAAP